jgi:hypothetical protein
MHQFIDAYSRQKLQFAFLGLPRETVGPGPNLGREPLRGPYGATSLLDEVLSVDVERFRRAYVPAFAMYKIQG